MASEPADHPTSGKLMLVGPDRDRILEKRFHAANWRVVTIADPQAAIESRHHESFDIAVVIARGSLINVAETIFNLRDINRKMEIILVVERVGVHASQLLRQLTEHPLARTRILTRRQLQKQISGLLQQVSPSGSDSISKSDPSLRSG